MKKKPLRVTKLRPDFNSGLRLSSSSIDDLLARVKEGVFALKYNDNTSVCITGRTTHAEPNIESVSRAVTRLPALIEWALTDPPISDVFAATGYQRTGVHDGYYVDKDKNRLYVIVDGEEYLAFPRT